jgi:protein SCO1
MMRFILFLFFIILFAACVLDQPARKLPILGNRDIIAGDTIYPKIPDFVFINQDSQKVTNATFEGKVYISDFFFIHCPTICPKVTANMLRVYKAFEQNDKVLLLAHSIDTRNDTVAALKRYAQKLGVKTEKWHFVTGDHDAIYRIANKYFSVAIVNPDAPGGFDHSGRLILTDKNRHVRSFCDGTDAKDVDRFIEDVKLLLKEEENK